MLDPVIREPSAIVGDNVRFEGPGYLGHFVCLGTRAFQHSGWKSPEEWQAADKETVIGSHFAMLPWTFIGAGTRVGRNFRADTNSFVGESSILGENVVLEYGARVYDGVTVGSNTTVGGFVCNDSIIGAGCVIQGSLIHKRTSSPPENSPRVMDGAFVGTNALIIGGITIGAGSFVGAGAVVVNDTEPGYLYTGVPARKRRRQDWF